MLEGKGLSRQCLHRNDNNKAKSFSKWKVCFGSHIRPLSPAWRWFCLMKIWFKKKKNVDQDKTIFIVLAFKTIQLRKKKTKTLQRLCVSHLLRSLRKKPATQTHGDTFLRSPTACFTPSEIHPPFPEAQGDKRGLWEGLPSTQMHTLTSGNRSLTDHLIKITNDLFFSLLSCAHERHLCLGPGDRYLKIGDGLFRGRYARGVSHKV